MDAHHTHGPDCGCPIAEVKRAEDLELRHVVIVGAGFGGLAAAAALAKAPVRVTLIDRRNHHLFQPLLYQVATAGLSPNQIATPIRTITRNHSRTEVLLGEVDGVDTTRKQVRLADRAIDYDYLILATGANHSYFGHDDWADAAPGLKTLEDATEVRKRILLAFERAELESDPSERARQLCFVVIGAGPTGIEMAGSIAELARFALAQDFRNINPECSRIVLVEGGPRILPAFPEVLSAHARRTLDKLGVEIALNTMVTGCDAFGVSLGRERIEARTIIWAAGVAASPVAKWLEVQGDRAGRIAVKPDLTVEGLPNVFVLGDCASAIGADGKPLPGLAPVAKQQGVYAAGVIGRAVAGKPAPPPFAYRDFGAMATVGRKSAIADFKGLRLHGFLGWLTWCLAHIYFLIGFRNRLAVAIDWAWSYLTFERGSRLITGPVMMRTENDGATKSRAA